MFRRRLLVTCITLLLVFTSTASAKKGGGGGTSTEYFNAELVVGGAFVFAGGTEMVTPNRKGNELLNVVSSEGPEIKLVMERPVENDGLAAEWDAAFEYTCPEFVGQVGEIWDDVWRITGHGGVRVILGNILLEDVEGHWWKATVQLIGDGVSEDPFLPQSGTSEFNMHRFAMWGRTVRRGKDAEFCDGNEGSFRSIDLVNPVRLEITALP